MRINSGESSGKGKKTFNWKLFILFLVITFLFLSLLIYLLLPGFFSGPDIKRIPIIIEWGRDEVRGLLWRLTL